MNTPTVELRCDSCDEPSFVYQLVGTAVALCAGCFVRAYVPESTFERRQRRARTPGPAAAGCLRTMRAAPAVAGVHRVLGQVSR